MKRFASLIVLLLFAGAFLRSQPLFPENGQLYTDTVVPAVYITIPSDTLAWIYANPYSDREFRATFVFDNGTIRDTIQPVGFRLRGIPHAHPGRNRSKSPSIPSPMAGNIMALKR